MKLGVIRATSPNISEFPTYIAMKKAGINPRFLAEFGAGQVESLQQMGADEVISLKGINHLLRFFPPKMKPFIRFAIEQKLGINSPLFNLEKYFNSDCYNISDLICHHALPLVRHINKSPGKKLFVTLWENIPDRYHRAISANHIKSRVTPLVAHYFPVSNYALAAARLYGIKSDNMTVIAPGVDTEKFRPSLRREKNIFKRFGCDEKTFIIVCISRIQRSKGIDTLLQAMAYLKTRAIGTDKIKTLIIGCGRETKLMKKLATRYGVSEDICFVGAIPFGKIPEYLSNADLFILPSTIQRYWQEQLGFSLLEAMSCGLPVISTHSGAIPEVVGDCGILVSPSSFYDLALAIERIYMNREYAEKLGASARDRVLSFYDAQKNGLKMAEIVLRHFQGNRHG